jgi:hypothetical protein
MAGGQNRLGGGEILHPPDMRQAGGIDETKRGKLGHGKGLNYWFFIQCLKNPWKSSSS